MTKHPSAQLAVEDPHAPLEVDESLVEMVELIEISSFGAPAARRLRALANPAVADQLAESHMRTIRRTPPRISTSTPPRTPVQPPIRPAVSQPPTEVRRSGGGLNTEWMADGNCAHESPATFFPSDGVGVEIARRICTTCPVREQCLEYALTNRIDNGVWGGLSERERRRVLKRRRMASLTQRSAQAGGQ
jgi:WhiB family redox-sensing transcriptional regulator